MIGVSVGQYECRRLLGEGGTGEVYLAVHRVLNTPRAVKVLRKEWTRYPDLVGRFINEACAAAAIRHRNIIGVHDCGQLPGGEWFILLDYLEGGTLTRFITSHGGPLAPHDVVHVLAEVANGLQAAHDHGIVHRDLKPDNIHLEQRDGDPRAATILDFGVAKLTEATDGITTEAGTLIGTPAYMAPEQLRGERVGPAADVFALGVITYQMVSGGRLPYQREAEVRDYYRLTPVELYQRVTGGPPIDLRCHAPEISPAWIRAIHAALDPDPARRPPTPRALALMLAEAMPGDGFSPSGVSLVRTYASELLEVGTAATTLRTPAPTSAAGAAGEGDAAGATGEPGSYDRRGAARYQARRRIGAGGMAEVFEGEFLGAEGFARQIAIKKVRPELARDPRFAEMFIAEARLASQLAHPNLVSVLDFDRDPEGRPFLVMEYVDGQDLATLLRRGELPPEVAIFIASEMLRGLGYAHQLPQRDGRRGLIHRDLSPHNVLLSRDGAVKVSDFGIARALEERGVVCSSAISGKPAYMSPEQAHAQPLDARSDLFAVGIILWEMLTGERLFTGSTRELQVQVQFKPLPAPSQVRSGLSPDLDAVVMKLLERDRDKRMASAYQAAAQLLACAAAPRDGRGVLVQLLAERASAPTGPRTREQELVRAREWAVGTGGNEATVPTPTLERRAGRGKERRSAKERRRWQWRWRSLLGLAALAGLGGAAMATSALRGAADLLDAAPGQAASALTASVMAAGSSTEPAPAAAAPAVTWRTTATATATAMTTAMTTAMAMGETKLQAETVERAPHQARRPSANGAARLLTSAAAGAALTGDNSQGVLVVAIRPWATVWVDGKPYGETPVHIRLSAGRHRVRIANHRASRELAVSIAAARSTLIEQELEP